MASDENDPDVVDENGRNIVDKEKDFEDPESNDVAFNVNINNMNNMNEPERDSPIRFLEAKEDTLEIGYDPDMFIDQNEIKKYTCLICQMIMKEPTDIGCGRNHHFCRVCVDEFYKRNDPAPFLIRGSGAKCPKCSQPINRSLVEEDEEKQCDILTLEVKCLKCNQWQGSLADHENIHSEQCQGNNNSSNSLVIANNREKPPFQISVRTLEGHDIFFHGVTGKLTIKELKQKVEDKEGIPPKQQRLMYRGRNVDVVFRGRPAVLDDYKIQDQSCITLIKRLKGGYGQ